MFFPDRVEKRGNNNSTRPTATIKASNDIRMDSPRNWRINVFFSAPNTFLTPTSAERFEDLAVERFIKFIQAISRVNNAIEASIYKYTTLPTCVILFGIPECRCRSLTGIRNCFL